MDKKETKLPAILFALLTTISGLFFCIFNLRFVENFERGLDKLGADLPGITVAFLSLGSVVIAGIPIVLIILAWVIALNVKKTTASTVIAFVCCLTVLLFGKFCQLAIFLPLIEMQKLPPG
jgi:hypothetical protein